MSKPMLTKEQAQHIIDTIRVSQSLDVDYIYEVYEMANEVIGILPSAVPTISRNFTRG